MCAVEIRITNGVTNSPTHASSLSFYRSVVACKSIYIYIFSVRGRFSISCYVKIYTHKIFESYIVCIFLLFKQRTVHRTRAIHHRKTTTHIRLFRTLKIQWHFRIYICILLFLGYFRCWFYCMPFIIPFHFRLKKIINNNIWPATDYGWRKQWHKTGLYAHPQSVKG